MTNTLTDLKKLSASIETHVGNKIRERRICLKLKQSDIAGKMGITGQQIHKYEKGVDRIPASRLYELSKILFVSLDFFYEGLEGEASLSKGQELVVTCANMKGKKVKIEFLNLEVILCDLENL
ncbi:helix-turn-helix domain-containing protein [Candidatus Paracaedibacter symbiosus]|uniref:helix-turn-helix domain-containing protein n=1 Tax=Candidatus Paracaedibacter symbiosus TaxID=244582 RepID=UPI0006916682|nr:helix-turn-helix transcriptional regulator [Candidatus Paracaedibacter symbiosus]